MSTKRTSQPQSVEAQDALEVCEQHLDALSVATRLLEGFRVSECAGGIASVLVDTARDFALWRLWAAFGLERARATVMGLAR